MTYVIRPSRFETASDTMLLDETGLGSAAAAYSVARQLRAAYSGDAIRVRRSSDNAETDIGFSGGVLDESALTAFVGAGDGHIVTLYDQSGSGRDATQPTSSKQGKIVVSGVVQKDGGTPAVVMDGVNSWWFYSGDASGAQTSATVYGVFNVATDAGASNIKIPFAYGDSDTDAAQIRTGRAGNSAYENHPAFTTTSSSTNAISSAANTNQVLVVGVVSGTDLSMYENNNSEVSSTSGAISVTGNKASVGVNISSQSVGTMVGGDYWQEGVAWLSDLDAYVGTIKSNVNAHYGIW